VDGEELRRSGKQLSVAINVQHVRWQPKAPKERNRVLARRFNSADAEIIMAQQVPIDPHARADNPKADDARADNTHEIAPDLAYRRLGIVNCVFVGSPGAGDRGWVLIDTGVAGTKGLITRAAAERFGDGARPAALILTHAHFDHVNALDEFAREWDAPVYAHALEQPYLNGSASYPPPDPMVGGGLMALTSTLLPRGPFTAHARMEVAADPRS
jgi:glyoxylase-like metal-dependent hydrolase (beta-lactamase superfamily II)